MVLEIISTNTKSISPLRINSLGGYHSFESLGRRPQQARCMAKHVCKGYTLRRAVTAGFDGSYLKPNMLGIRPDPPIWPEREQVLQEVMRDTIQRRANSMDFPFSLRMIKKKENKANHHSKPVDISEADCSVNNAFSAMADIIMGIQNHALQVRETASSRDHQHLITKVQTEMRGSFACIFQHVFSPNPSLMTAIMILVSDFCVHSVLHAMSAKQEKQPGSDFLAVNENRHEMAELKMIFPSRSDLNEDDGIIGEEEMELWKSIVEEAGSMQEELLNNIHEDTFSSSTVEIEMYNYHDFFMTDLSYQMNLFEDPHNPLLLCNYAQFLQLVTHDYDRAEECYKRAIHFDPTDASSLSQYANFLWVVRHDIWNAEQQYQEAIAAEPENSYYISAYAHFLWNTGGEDTCFPPQEP